VSANVARQPRAKPFHGVSMMLVNDVVIVS